MNTGFPRLMRLIDPLLLSVLMKTSLNETYEYLMFLYLFMNTSFPPLVRLIVLLFLTAIIKTVLNETYEYRKFLYYL